MAASDERYPAIKTTEVFSLKNRGIDEQFISSNHITMESDKYICIRMTDKVMIIDMNEPTTFSKIPQTPAFPIMNPRDPLLAYIKREGTTKEKLRIMNVETKMRIKYHNMNDKVLFWKWVTPTLLGLVTQTAVYHWSTEGPQDSEPVKVFDRSANLATSNIISYQCDPSENWCALIGTWSDPLFSGKMQLFSVKEQNSREFDAIIADFSTSKVPENDVPSTLICFATGFVTYEKERYRIQLNLLELGKPGFPMKHADFRIGHWPGSPFSLQISEKYGWVSVITKRGLVSMHDLETASSIYSFNISDHYMILTTKTSGGFYSINEEGQVLLTKVNDYVITDETFLSNDDPSTQHQQRLRAFLVRKKKLDHLEQLRQNLIRDGLKNENDELRKQRDNLKWHLLKVESAPSNVLEARLTEFTYEQVIDVTDNFSDSLKIGDGGYGTVYKANHGHPFAIKVSNSERDEVKSALNQEFEISRKFWHQNMVKLLGICKEPLVLIYELMPKGSLHDFLRDKERSKELTWKIRICIAYDVCQALICIHSSVPPIAHGDVTPSNILLDSNYTAKLTDFGIGRHLKPTNTRETPHHNTSKPRGSEAYVEPTYFALGIMTAMNDIYSFGIVLVELVTGKFPETGFRKKVEDYLKDGIDFVDDTAGNWPLQEAKKLVKLGLRCCDLTEKNRPNLEKEVFTEIKSMRRASNRL